ncbi:hypothetical protein C8F04DRAFT_1241148 [Mycena alexandri]|uniref:F-box domain-containing protein n=1 Tax=Mycena alexandri TaxID=1745969 RepID=A0AAD6S6M3_9AGAR|nr:hypothetical protein C8F04DRAFT_1241148 [Mycena alexandri]
MSIICEDCGHLNWYDVRFLPGTPAAQRAELADIQHQLKVLKARDRDLKAALASVVYPVLTLPPEITSHIFLDCLPFHGRVQPSSIKAPLVLAQVCQYWRDIALATPQLWSSIDMKLEIGQPNIPDKGTIALLLRTWLSRAKRSPISLTLRLPYHQPISKEVISVIPAYAGQLHRLELQASDSDCETLRAMCSDFPILRDIAITCYGSVHWLSAKSASHTSCPNGAFLQPYVSLHTLRLGEMSVATLLDMLTDLPQLLHLDTKIDDYPPFDSVGVVPVTANLESLIIRGREEAPDQAPDPPVLDYLTLPKLRRLELHYRLQLQALASFCIRSACVLEHLRLQVFTETECWGLMHMLPNFSGITSFDLDTYTCLDSVTYSLQDTTLLPHLRSLRLNSWRSGIDYATLVWCLRIRNRDLKSFTLDFENRGSPSSGVFQRTISSSLNLNLLLQAGMEVRIWTSEGVWPGWTSIPQKDSRKVRDIRLSTFEISGSHLNCPYMWTLFFQ